MPTQGNSGLPISVRHGEAATLSDDLARIGATAGGPVLIVVGDAARALSPQEADARRRLVDRVIVPVVRDTEAIVITGGTDAGLMREMGRCLAEHSPHSLLIGVAPDAKLRGFGAGQDDEDAADPEPHHRLLRTDGAVWGDEAPVLVDVAERLASTKVVLVAVGGGAGTRGEIQLALARQWPVLLTECLGGVSDDLAQRLTRGRWARLGKRDALVDALRAARERGEVRVESAGRWPSFARSLRWVLSDDLLLREAWSRYAFADSRAARLKVPTGWGAGTLIALAALTVVAAIAMSGVSDGSSPWLALKVAVTSLPLLAGVVLALLERSTRAGTWVSLRDAAESVLREVYRLRASAAPYGQGDRARFAESLAIVDARAGLRIADDGGVPPTWPPHGLETRISPGDQLLNQLNAQTYDVVRVQDQLEFLTGTARKKARYAFLWSAAIYLAAALGTLALAVSWRVEWTSGASAVAAVAAAVVAAFLSWRQYRRWEQEAESYRATTLAVRAARAHWLALGDEKRSSAEAFAEYVGTVEDLLAAEGSEWERSVREAQKRLFERYRPS